MCHFIKKQRLYHKENLAQRRILSAMCDVHGTVEKPSNLLVINIQPRDCYTGYTNATTSSIHKLHSTFNF